MNDLHDVEKRVTDETTGGQKGTKLTQLGALDPVALIELARVAGMGAEKYAAFNYLKGYDWALSFNAMQRHALLFWSGEDNDPESGLSHMAHAAWMALSLVSFALRKIGTDTRPAQPFTMEDALKIAQFDPTAAARLLGIEPVRPAECTHRTLDGPNVVFDATPIMRGVLCCNRCGFVIPENWQP